uniref:Histone deacetylase 10 n=1 Tax=Mastacembelus armatus TaxID=205130 RepID=A0A7N8YQW9_9TELE
MAAGTALIYDEEMTKYKLLWVDPACKIEAPERLTVSHEALVRSGLADRCVSIPVREATDEDILLVHSEEYLEAVKKTPYMTLEDLKEFTLHYGDVYFHPNIYHCAKLAAGATLQLVDSVMMAKVRNGMALVRPPGHHSMRSAANGFCVFNNVAIAAQYAKQKYGLKRVLIVDWDVHHGQGVQYCFEDDPSVLYFSWHRYEHQKFWPNLRESDFDSVGKEKGAGFTINVPWNDVSIHKYCSVKIINDLLKMFKNFSPDLVLVSAGFDSAIGDPEGEMCATPDIFAHLTHLLMNLAGGKVCAVLEGGYNLTSLAQSVCQTVQTLLGEPAPRPANLEGPCKRSVSPSITLYIVRCQTVPCVFMSDCSAFIFLFQCTGVPSLLMSLCLITASQICSGLALVHDVSMAMMCVVQHAAAALSNRYSNVEPNLVVFVLPQGCGDMSGFMHAVLGLLLPLGYEYDPSLVLLVQMPDSGLSDSVWQHLIGLLQGLAQGHTLVLMQEVEGACVRPTASSLLGEAAPSLGQLHAPLPEDVEAIESLRHKLKADWKLLQTTGEFA